MKLTRLGQDKRAVALVLEHAQTAADLLREWAARPEATADLASRSLACATALELDLNESTDPPPTAA